MKRITLKITALVINTLVLVMLLFSISHFALPGHMSQQIVDCPFMPGHSSICKMSPMEHIQAWQSMFTMLPAKDALSFLAVLLALLALLGLNYFRKHTLYDQLELEPNTKLFYLRSISIFDPLKEAFSRGILNPKTF